MLRLRLLGAPSVLDDAREIYLPSQKAQALLCYLAAEADRSFARSQIIALLWEESCERERWQQRWLNVLDQLIEGYAAAGAWTQALDRARRATAADPLQERFHRALMQLHYRAGDRAAALAQYRICRDVLERELGVEP